MGWGGGGARETGGVAGMINNVAPLRVRPWSLSLMCSAPPFILFSSPLSAFYKQTE